MATATATQPAMNWRQEMGQRANPAASSDTRGTDNDGFRTQKSRNRNRNQGHLKKGGEKSHRFTEHDLKTILEKIKHEKGFRIENPTERDDFRSKTSNLCGKELTESDVWQAYSRVISKIFDHRKRTRDIKRGKIIRDNRVIIAEKLNALKSGQVTTDEFIEWVGVMYNDFKSKGGKDEGVFAATKFLGKVIGLNDPVIVRGIIPLIKEGAMRLNTYQPLNMIVWSKNQDPNDMRKCMQIIFEAITNPFQKNEYKESPMDSAYIATQEKKIGNRFNSRIQKPSITHEQYINFCQWILTDFPAEKCVNLTKILLNNGSDIDRNIAKFAWCCDKSPNILLSNIIQLFTNITRTPDEECKRHAYPIIETWVNDQINIFKKVNRFIWMVCNSPTLLSEKAATERDPNEHIYRYFENKYRGKKQGFSMPIDRFYSIMYHMAITYEDVTSKPVGALIGCLMRRRASSETVGKAILHELRQGNTRGFNILKHFGRVPPSIRKDIDGIVTDKSIPMKIRFSVEGVVKYFGHQVDENGDLLPTCVDRDGYPYDKLVMDSMAQKRPFTFTTLEPPFMLNQGIQQAIENMLENIGYVH